MYTIYDLLSTLYYLLYYAIIYYITPWRQKDPKQTSFQGITAGFQGSTHWTGCLLSGPYIWGPTVFGAPLLVLGKHSLDWGLQSGAYSLGAYIWGTTVFLLPILGLAAHSLSWGLQSGGLQSGGLQSQGTDFGSRSPLTGLGPTVWGPTVWGPTSGGLQSLDYQFWISGRTHWTGAYSLGAYRVSSGGLQGFCYRFWIPRQ